MSFLQLIRDWLIDPLGLLFMLSLVFLAVLAFKRINLCLIIATGVWLGSVCFVSAPLIVNPMLLHFENQFVEEPDCLAARPLVVLGGGVDSRAARADEVHFMDSATFTRTVKAKELSMRFPDAPVLVAGGALVEVSEAAVIGHYLRNAGVRETRIHEEGSSANTFENAANIKALIDKQEFDEHIILITSALHMKRAKAVFEKQGLTVCPVAVDRHGLDNIPVYALWPQISAMQKFDLLLHEAVAWVLYKLTDRI